MDVVLYFAEKPPSDTIQKAPSLLFFFVTNVLISSVRYGGSGLVHGLTDTKGSSNVTDVT